MTEVVGAAFCPVDKSLTIFRIDHEDLLSKLYSLIKCSTVECINLSPTMSVWCDEEFLFKQQQYMEENDGFIPVTVIPGLDSPLMGKLVFLGGTDKHGNTLDLDFVEFDHLRKKMRTGKMISTLAEV